MGERGASAEALLSECILAVEELVAACPPSGEFSPEMRFSRDDALSQAFDVLDVLEKSGAVACETTESSPPLPSFGKMQNGSISPKEKLICSANCSSQTPALAFAAQHSQTEPLEKKREALQNAAAQTDTIVAASASTAIQTQETRLDLNQNELLSKLEATQAKLESKRALCDDLECGRREAERNLKEAQRTIEKANDEIARLRTQDRRADEREASLATKRNANHELYIAAAHEAATLKGQLERARDANNALAERNAALEGAVARMKKEHVAVAKAETKSLSPYDSALKIREYEIKLAKAESQMAEVDAKFKELWHKMKRENDALREASVARERDSERALQKAKTEARAERQKAAASEERAQRVESRVSSLENEARRLRSVLRKAQEQESLMRTIAKIREPERDGRTSVGFDAVVKTIDQVSEEVDARVKAKVRRRK